jgi:hypothetical protein
LIVAAQTGAVSGSERPFRIARIDAGSQIYIEPEDTFINTVIPREMAGHFLFDGEHAEIFGGAKPICHWRRRARHSWMHFHPAFLQQAMPLS